ncbi:MAG: hypothetical protein AVDCRST_MAG18-2140, partial [uncultured Thermomicrobiales bacterium]
GAACARRDGRRAGEVGAAGAGKDR